MKNSGALMVAALAVFCLYLWLSPAAALALGAAASLLWGPPPARQTHDLAGQLLKASVVGLGFGMNLQEVLRVGREGFLYTAFGIVFALGAGRLLGRLLRVEKRTSYLVSVGTAICGGSAIAALGPVLEADEDSMSVALATVFALNGLALILFPPIGRALGLDGRQFGLWAALAIHDTSSVVGAALKYGPSALAVATAAKLARALWIVPVSLATAAVRGSGSRVRYPWFILLFALAAALNTALPALAPAWKTLGFLAKASLTATLFLIGTSLTPATFAKAGPRSLAQGILLWALVGATSLALIRTGIIH